MDEIGIDQDRLGWENRGLSGIAGHSALDESVGIALRRVDSCVCSGVLQALVPAQICIVKLATVFLERACI